MTAIHIACGIQKGQKHQYLSQASSVPKRRHGMSANSASPYFSMLSHPAISVAIYPAHKPAAQYPGAESVAPDRDLAEIAAAKAGDA